MAEPCGDKDLMRAAGGQTVDEPCSGVLGVQFYCNIPDVGDWKQRVAELMAMMVVTWNKLFDIETKAIEDGRVTERVHTANEGEIADRWQRIQNHLDNVEEVPWYGIGDLASKAIAQYAGIVQDQACVLEMMQTRIKELGGKPPKVPYFKPKPRLDLDDWARKQTEGAPNLFTGLLIVGGILGAAYLLRPVLLQVLASRKGAAPVPRASVAAASKGGKK